MSQLMLDDEKVMSDINPFADTKNFFPPGTSRQYNDYKKHKPPVEEPEEEYVSPACGVLTKGVGRLGYREDKCSLSRPLIPGRNIDMGVDEKKLLSFETVSSVVQDVKKVAKNMKTLDIFTIVLIVLIILALSSVRR